MSGASTKPARPPLEISEIEAAYVAAAIKLTLDHYGSRLLPRDREIMLALKARLAAGFDLSDEVRVVLDG
jgi:hypothetical protein